ncbi:hypothetical protein, partial [Escherichia coli]|uniref:hypothetical protein n=1 Tax=Escherichia coli TaxID=562 RepID=UPI003D8FCBC0
EGIPTKSVRWQARWDWQADWFLRSQRYSIDGETEGWFTTIRQTFEAYHWHVIHEIDGHDPQAVKEAILEAQSVKISRR